MSLLSYNELCALVEDGVIEGVDLKDVNGTSIDVHLGPDILHENTTGGREVSLLKKEALDMSKWDITGSFYLLRPGEFILAHTTEVFNLPDNISAEFKLNSSGARIGLENALATWCLTGATKIPLLDGTEARIKDLVGRSDLWVYSLDAEGNFVPGRASKVFISGEVSRTVVVTLDSGDKFECTPEHKVMLRDGTYQEAKSLNIGVSVMPLYRRIDGEHEAVYSPRGCRIKTESHTFQGAHVSTHRQVFSHINGNIPDGYVVHHKDFNPRNNTPSNLQLVSTGDHIGIHSKSRMSQPAAKLAASKNMAAVNKRLWSDPEFTSRKNAASSVLMTGLNSKLWSDPNHVAKMKVIQRETALKHLCKVDRALITRAGKIGCIKKTLVKIFKSGVAVTAETYTSHKRQNAPTVKTLEKEFGNFERALAEAGYANHKVVSVRTKRYKTSIKVYDITVPKYHNFALACGVYVHNCDPWWHGSVLTLELKNLTQFHTIRLDNGCRIGQMIFHRSEPVPKDRGYGVRGRYNRDTSVQSVKV